VHPNPNVRAAVHRILAGSPNVELHEPFDYLELVRHLRRARLVVTDSGGLQEESPTFGCPVVVVRDRTDRPEAVAAGLAVLAGSSRLRIVAAVTRLLTDPAAHRRMTGGANPYGDGRAAERIAAALAGESFVPFRAAERRAGASRG
jgi:UDP-N-acetylglucosamine 2-epimerase (non-hydrolysing)